MLRVAWFLFCLFWSTLFFGATAIVSGVLRIRNRPGGVYDWCAREWSRFMLWVAGTPVAVVGLEHVPAGRPVVYVSNHQSWFDIWALAARLPGQVRFVSKMELARVPILGGAMQSAGHIFLDRTNRQAAFAAYEEAAQTIRDGMSAVVFPEGTRSRTGELQPFKKGPFVFGIAAQVPLVPVYCAGTFDILPKGKVRINSHPIALYIGPPIDTVGFGYEDRERIMAMARQAVEALREKATGARNPVPGPLP